MKVNQYHLRSGAHRFKLQEKALNCYGMRIRYMDPKRMTNILHMSHLSHISAFMLGKQ
jgi:hypothetical protein